MKKLVTSKWFLIVIIPILGIVIYLNVLLAFDGTIQEVIFNGNDLELDGLLLRPDTPGPHPAIVLLHGAGGNHQAYDKWYNRFHVNAFLAKGFAVLIYTKRGSGDHDIDYTYFTYKDLMKDAVGAITFLKNQKGIDAGNIGVMGISESGWFTPEVAYEVDDLQFIINRVGSPLSVTNTVIHEVRMDAKADGFTEQEIEESIVPLTLRIWKFYVDVANDPTLANGAERNAINKELSEMNNHKRLKNWFKYDSLNPYDPNLYISRASNYSYDPKPFLEEINVPIFYVLAGQDVNMPTKEIVDFLRTFKKEYNKDITIKVYPNAGHYLYRWRSLPIEGLYEPGYLDELANWAVKQID